MGENFRGSRLGSKSRDHVTHLKDVIMLHAAAESEVEGELVSHLETDCP